MITKGLQDRIEGSLVGAAIGAELGWARRVHPERFRTTHPEEILKLKLKPVDPKLQHPGPFRQPPGIDPLKRTFEEFQRHQGFIEPHPKRWQSEKLTSFIDLGVRAYVNKQGRVGTEDFGTTLMNDRGISQPIGDWDGIHSTQELLKEGCTPRISGIGCDPSGLIAAAMPAVGIYHHGDVEYAYLDGVELASVVQPRLGADWAALAAAAIAAAFDPTLDAQGLVAAVLKIAERNNPEIFYELSYPLNHVSFTTASLDKDLLDWCYNYGNPAAHRELNAYANNPLRFVLPLLKPFDGDAQTLMAVLLGPPQKEDSSLRFISMMHSVTAILAGSILGARHGRSVFPREWLEWAEPIAKDWFPMTQVVEKRRQREQEIISVYETMSERKQNGMSLLEDKVYGCLLASSIGNAMGSPTEWEWFEVVDEKFPGGVKTVLDPSRLEGEDDNQMAMLLVETYLERAGQPVMARHFGATLNRSPGGGNINTLMRAGWDPRVIGCWQVVTGATVMCFEPVGIYHLADPDYAVIDATAISYLYQRGLDVTAPAILAAATAVALRPDATVDSVLDAALKAAPSDPLQTFDERGFKSCRDYLETCLAVADKYDDVMAARKELYDKCLFYSPIDPLEVLGLAFAMFKIAKGDVRQSAIGGTNIGRDADTIAGRSAMLAGALRGAGNVPAEWIRMFSQSGLERIRHHAKAMVDLITGRKLRVLKNRQMK